MKTLFCFLFLYITAGDSYAQWLRIYRDSTGVVITSNGSLRLSGGKALLSGAGSLGLEFRVIDEVALLRLNTKGIHFNSTDYAGISFNNPERYEQGVCLWRYKPWNSWTKPMRVEQPSLMPEDDVQFFYYQYDDSLYAAVVPLSGNGFRTTLGKWQDKWGSKSQSFAPTTADSIPCVAIAFGKDPFALFEKIYSVSLEYMGMAEDRRVLKKFPEIFDYLGWCTWNASDNGKNLNQDLLIRAAESFAKKKIPVGWFLIDDGWFQQRDRRLQSYEPDSASFPNGFKPVLDKLKTQFGIKYAGIWHAFNGLWNGIDSASFLGRHYKNVLFSYKGNDIQNENGNDQNQYFFIRPDSDSLYSFYRNWYTYLKGQGFDFVKVDNQRITEQMAAGNYPVFTLSDSMHEALYHAAKNYFNGAVINCMDMTAEAYFNFGSSAIARAVEDYFPYTSGENYNLQKGNAAAHVLQAVYNSIYFGKMVYPDFDLFQSHNPNGIYHAIARAINNGPIYITDDIGEQNITVLSPLLFSDGKIIHSQTPLVPTRDCLFQVQDAKLFKAFSMIRNSGLLGAFNAADVDLVNGFVKPADINGIEGSDFIMYEYFSKTWKRLCRDNAIPVQLRRMGYRLYYVIPVKKNFAAIGLENKYNGPATIIEEKSEKNKITIRLYEGGSLIAYSAARPVRISINGKKGKFTYQNHLIKAKIPAVSQPVVSFFFSAK